MPESIQGTWNIVRADLSQSLQAEHFIQLLNEYACDPMGGKVPLPEDVKQRLLIDLPALPGLVALLAYDDARPVGLANALLGYSTFAARPLLNLHDIMVTRGYRQRGVAQALLHALEGHARSLGCCKLTLEVLQGNQAAMAAYRRFGFSPYQLDPHAGDAVFWQKVLD